MKSKYLEIHQISLENHAVDTVVSAIVVNANCKLNPFMHKLLLTLENVYSSVLLNSVPINGSLFFYTMGNLTSVTLFSITKCKWEIHQGFLWHW